MMLQRAASGAMMRRLHEDRWHFQHGPIDLIIGIDGDRAVVTEAIDEAFAAFAPMLGELVCHLPALRRPVVWQPGDRTDGFAGCSGAASDHAAPALAARVASRMIAACQPHAKLFVTPMAAVAGSVADEVLALLWREGIRRAFVNNGGDIALNLAPGAHFTFAIADSVAPDAMQAASSTRVRIDSDSPVRGLATSGWQGRSLSLGIADAVTVLARSAAQADVGATLVANAVDVDSPAVQRARACDRVADSDLRALPVTVSVGALSPQQISQALAAGSLFASECVQRGEVIGARLLLSNEFRLLGRWPGMQPHSAGQGVSPRPMRAVASATGNTAAEYCYAPHHGIMAGTHVPVATANPRRNS